MPPIVSRSAWCLFSFPLPPSRLFTLARSSSSLRYPLSILPSFFPLFRSLRFLFLLLFLLLHAATARRFCVCLSDGGRKRSRKFICRDVAPYSKTRMIYLHGAEGETDEMDLLEKGLSSVTRRSGGGGEKREMYFLKETR